MKIITEHRIQFTKQNFSGTSAQRAVCCNIFYFPCHALRSPLTKHNNEDAKNVKYCQTLHSKVKGIILLMLNYNIL